MTTKQLWWLLPLACLAACSNGANHERYLQGKADSISVSDSTGTHSSVPLNSAERKIVHSADMTCKVSSVMTAINTLEHSVTAVGGVVEESNMSNTLGETKTVYYKPDSLRQVQTYTTSATMRLRIPVAMFDSVIRTIPGMVSFIDSRSLKRTDVTAMYMGNKAVLNTGTKVYSKEQALKLAKKADDLVKIQEYEDENSRGFIDRKVAQMELQDAIDYATFTIALAQPQQVYTQVIVNPDYAATIPFGTRAMLAVSSGWGALKEVLLVFISIWPFLLCAALAISVIFYIRRRLSPYGSQQPTN